MSRSDSVVGLSERGRALVEGARSGEVALHLGLCDAFPLHTYELSGRVLREVVQADVWSGGPTWFLTLVELENGKTTPVADADWTEQEISDVMGECYGSAVPRVTDENALFFADFEDVILSGRMHLAAGDAGKFERWREARSTSTDPQAHDVSQTGRSASP